MQAASYRSSRVRIEGVHPLPCRADDVDVGMTPVDYAVVPGALRVVAPAVSALPESTVAPSRHGLAAERIARSIIHRWTSSSLL